MLIMHSNQEVLTASLGVLAHLYVLSCSIDIPGMFEAKGVKGAKERLQLLVGDVRQPFPDAAQGAQVRWDTVGQCCIGFLLGCWGWVGCWTSLVPVGPHVHT